MNYVNIRFVTNIPILDLCESTSSAETFLLASAALANLTFMEPSAVHAMQRNGTVRVLVSAVCQQGVNI